MIMAGEEDRPAIERVVRLQQSLGVDAAIIGIDDVRQLSPKADLTNIVGGCFEKKSGYADPRATVYALAQRAKELGAVVQQLCAVRDIRRSGDRIAGVITNHGEISTPIVVNAAGPWAGIIGRMVGVGIAEMSDRCQVSTAVGARKIPGECGSAKWNIFPPAERRLRDRRFGLPERHRALRSGYL